MKRAYPDRAAIPAAVFTADTLARTTSRLLEWRQGPGNFGQLLLHACWGEASTLSRGYHGQTIAYAYWMLEGVMMLANRSADDRWRLLVHDMIGNILHLQTRDGGFYHASSEFEPTYTCQESCPIHQGLPVLALLDYLCWPEADPCRKAQAEAAIKKWWRWIESYWWKRGNGWKAPLDLPGYCGVTNQDLVIVAVLARQARLSGDWERYERHGRPVLDAYLSPAYYHERIGQFERGDKANFTERTSYYDVIVPMLEIIHDAAGDERLPAVIDNVVLHLFDTLQPGTDGLIHVARGAVTDPTDKTRVIDWEQGPHAFSAYPGLLRILQKYLRRHPDQKREHLCASLEKTLAAYVYADGTIPIALGGDPMFAVAGYICHFWMFLLHRLPEADVSMDIVPMPSLSRSCGEVTWRENGDLWTIERNGTRLFAGLKRNPHGVVSGPDGIVRGANPSELAKVDIEEIVGA